MSADVQHAQNVLDQVLAASNHAGASWNSTGLADVYTEDAMLYGGRPGHAVGRAAIHAYFASYDGVIQAGEMQMRDCVLRVLGGDCLLAQGMAHFSFTLAQGEKTRSSLRATLVLKQQPDRWRILDHHFSTIPVAPPLGKDDPT